MKDNTRDDLLKRAEAVLHQSEAQETEVILTTDESYLTRFANNVIHQNVGSDSAGVVIRAITGQRIGVATAEGLEPETLRRTLRTAQEIAAVRPPLEDFRRLPKPRTIRPVDAFDAATAACTPAHRAEIVAELVAAAKRRKAEAAGLVQTAAWQVLIANSRGVRAFHRSTSAQFQTVVTCGDGSGYAEEIGHALDGLDVRRVIRDGVAKAARSRRPQPIDAGEYDVVLEPAAVGIMLRMLGYVGLGAKAFQEGHSFLSGKLGQKVTGDLFTLTDNARDRRLCGMPFDWEGVPRKRVKLIERGVGRGVVYDSYLAGREKGRRQSTGHALPPMETAFRALPIHLVMDGGGESLRSLVAGTERGLLVTRFHYVNVAEPVRTVLTGMTRDGTFRIENGRITGAVRNLRFTESVLGAFARAEGLTRMRRVVEGSTFCPAAKIRGFRFTGTTDF